MVRINSIVPPEVLSDQHLVAEYNESLMLAGTVIKHGVPPNPPKSYVLGKGHINFFRSRMTFVKFRFYQLKEEMARRGFNSTKDFPELPETSLGDYEPKENDLVLIYERIKKKIENKPGYYKYRGNILSGFEKVLFFERFKNAMRKARKAIR